MPTRNRLPAFCSLFVVILIGSSCGVAMEQRSLRRADLRAELYLERLEAFGFSGAVLVAPLDSAASSRGYGLANREAGTSFEPTTIFDIGSITKQFTAAAILRLQADGRLSVQDSIGRFFPAVPEDKRGITLHHLLTHTSGLPMGLGGDYRRVTRDSLVTGGLSAELNAAPGEAHGYSNLGYSLLAAVIELVSGQSYEEFLRDRLFRPAGMVETGYTIETGARPRLAVGYEGGERWGIGTDSTAATGGQFWNLLGNGGLQSSVVDLHRWAVALLEGAALPPHEVAELFRPHVLAIESYRDPGTSLYYGYGWYIWERPSGPIIFHDGGNGIFYASLRILPGQSRILAFGSNTDEFTMTRATPVLALTRIVAGEDVAMPPQVTSPPGDFEEFAGTYVDSGEQNLLRVTLDDDAIRVLGEGQHAFNFLRTGSWSADPVLDSLNTRTARFMDLSRAARFSEMGEFFASPDILARIQGVEERFWERRESALGAFRETRVLGTVPSRRGGLPARVWVAIDFLEGTEYRDFVWDENRVIVDYGPVNRPDMPRFLPVSSRCIAAFHAADALTVGLCFGADAGRQRHAEVDTPAGVKRLDRVP
jgi:CubicO group peptidase (beta-lactamase class C family)